MVGGYISEKSLIFFTPGRAGSVFELPSKKYITIQQLLKTQEYLVHQNNKPVVYIEERRSKKRSRIKTVCQEIRKC